MLAKGFVVLAFALVAGALANGAPTFNFNLEDMVKCVAEAKKLERPSCNICWYTFFIENSTLAELADCAQAPAPAKTEKTNNGEETLCDAYQDVLTRNARAVSHMVKHHCEACRRAVGGLDEEDKKSSSADAAKGPAVAQENADAETKKGFTEEDCGPLCTIDDCTHEVEDYPLDVGMAHACRNAVKEECDDAYHMPPV